MSISKHGMRSTRQSDRRQISEQVAAVVATIEEDDHQPRSYLEEISLLGFLRTRDVIRSLHGQLS